MYSFYGWGSTTSRLESLRGGSLLFTTKFPDTPVTHMQQNQKKILFSSFIVSHFSYYPLIWMFCSKKSTKKINAVHERSLQIIRNDYEIRGSTPNNISPTIYKFSYDRSL